MSDFEDAVRRIAAHQGRDPREVMAEMLQSQMQGPRRPPQLPQQAPRTEVVPAHQGPQGYPMPARYAGVSPPRDEGEAEVIARYLQAESGPDGVFGEGGMTAGGIFGGEAVATQGHDPSARQRSQLHALTALAGQMAARPAPMPQPTPARMPAYAPPQPPAFPPQQVRVIERTVVYEGPAPQGAPQLPRSIWPFW